MTTPLTSTARKRAERALGKALPPGAEVHHVNGDPTDNRPSNLVICQDKAYHRFLHERARARGWTPAPGHGAYILRDVDDQLWRQVKSKAALEGVSIKTLIERLLTEWLTERRRLKRP